MADKKIENIHKLIKYVRKGQVVPFLGAGFSFASGAPRVSDIVAALLDYGGEDFQIDLSKNHVSLRNLSQEFIKKFSRNELIEILSQLFNFPIKDTSAQNLLAKISHFRTIYTTNYDTLIESAYPKEERTVITSNAGCAYVRDNKINIYKIHGDITSMNDPDGIVITDDDYKNYFLNHRYDMIWSNLQQDFVKRNVLFIGYSLEDDNVLEIIKHVRECVGANMKKMFLVAPGLSPLKVSQIEKNNVDYIDTTAKDILELILSSLKENVVKDYEHKQISQEIYDNFLEKNGKMYTTTTHLQNENKIENVQPMKDEHIDSEVLFKVPLELGNHIKNRNFKSFISVKGINYPALYIKKDELLNFSLKQNGITFISEEDIKGLIITPARREHNFKIIVPSIHFVDNVSVILYNYKELVCDIDLPICLLHITLKINSGDPQMQKSTINVKFKDRYSSNLEAQKWIDVITALYTGEDVKIGPIRLKGAKASGSIVSELTKMKEYYQLINDIESNTNVTFKCYDGFSERNLLKAKYVYYYNVKQGFVLQLPKGSTLSCEIDTRDRGNYPISKFENDHFFMFEVKRQVDFFFNGNHFIIPFITQVFQDCKSKEIKRIDEYHYNIVMQNVNPISLIYCRNQEPKQVGREMIF